MDHRLRIFWPLIALCTALACGENDSPQGGDGHAGSSSSNDSSEDGHSGAYGVDDEALGGAGGASSEISQAFSGDLNLTWWLAQSAPLFLSVGDDRGNYLGLLASKDGAGNPVTVTGAKLRIDELFAHVEFSTSGQLRLVADEDELILFSDYTSNSVTISYLTRKGDWSRDVVDASAEELAALRIEPNRFDFVEKSSEDGGSGIADRIVGFAECTIGNVVTAEDALAPDWTKSPKKELLIATAQCGAKQIPNSLLPDQLVRIALGAQALQQAGTCMVGVGSAVVLGSLLFSGIGTGVGVVLGTKLAAGAILGTRSCVDFVKTVGDIKQLPKSQAQAAPERGLQWYETEQTPYYSVAVLPQGADPGAEDFLGKPVLFRDQPRPVQVVLGGDTGRNVESLKSVVADLSGIGGPTAAELEYLDGAWRWNGEVNAWEGGSYGIPVSIDDRKFQPTAPLGLVQESGLSVQLVPSKTDVALGETVELVAVVTGGQPPYEVACAIDDTLGPEGTLTLTVQPTKRSRYRCAVQDQSRTYAYFDVGEVWINVCGDGECSLNENCATDCGEPTGAGGGSSGGGPGSGGSGGSDGSSSGGAISAGGTIGAGGIVATGGTLGTGGAGGGLIGPPAPPGNAAIAWGDPHLGTFDGLQYDVQPIGELTLVRDPTDNLEIQIRTARYSSRTTVSIAVAARVGEDRVNLLAGGTTLVNGALVTLGSDRYDLATGGSLYRRSGVWTLVWPDNSQLRVVDRGSYVDVHVDLASSRKGGTVEGLLGNFDDVVTGDLRTRGGLLLASNPTFEAFYGGFVESWRITNETSLFDYAEGENTETFTDRTFPRQLLRVQDLDPALADEATGVCEAAGVTDWLEACIIDVAESGDADFASTYPSLRAPKLALDVKPPVVAGATNGGVLDAFGSLPAMSGVIVPNGAEFFTFTASEGEGIQLRMVDVANGTLSPWIRVYDAAGSVVLSASASTVAYTNFAAPSSGTFTVVVAGSTAAGGDYELHFVKAPGANEGGLLTPGGSVTGTITTGDLDSYIFEANAGEGIQLRLTDVGGASLYPRLTVYSPSGGAIDAQYGATATYSNFSAPTSGTYTVVVSDWTSGVSGTGDYELHFVKAPGANEGGLLTPGGSVTGTITTGDLDSYTFEANAGEGIQLRLADVGGASLYPRLTVYSPSGGAIDAQYGTTATYTNFSAPTSGTYTVVVSDWTSGVSGTGDYELHFVKAPGANEGGLLTPGGSVTGTITVGDLDSYTFEANAGEGIQLRLADVGGAALYPRLTVYSPSGGAIDAQYGTTATYANFSAPMSGTYTVVVSDWTSGVSGTGDYELHFVKAPGANEGGLLTPGGSVTGTITVGDLDSYTFEANAGEGIQLRLADVGGAALYPRLTVYSPSGSGIDAQYGTTATYTNFSAPTSGTYTVVVSDWTSGVSGTGDYELHFVKAPGANEGGLLTPGGSVTGTITVGDLDSYTFEANAGEGIQLRLADVGGAALYPRLTVYSPSGSGIDAQYGATATYTNFSAPTSGTYTVVVSDWTSGVSGTGDYELHFVKAPGANEGGLLTPGGSVTGTITVGDLDSYTFDANAGDTVQLSVTDLTNGPLVPAIALYRPEGGLLRSTSSATTATIAVIVPVSGTYTVVIYDWSSGVASSGDYTLDFQRSSNM